ncbi:MAG: tetratricopeptide repeat protein [Magnetococcales bacterium]|nr:tetratricopeptide repeat protein [Magnetococcales bacterium]NGZ27011.1 tetratricopeptide repeat protein [Magnetococcales bacterium]
MTRLSHLLIVTSLVLLSACGTTTGERDSADQLELNVYKGKAYMERNNPQMALPSLRRVQELDPNNVENLILLGSAYFLLDRPIQAIATYQRALELKPSGEVHNRLGMVYLRNEKMDDAIQEFKLALADPLFATPEEPCYFLAMIEKKRKNTDAMVGWLNKALQIKPDHPSSHLELAGYYHFKGQYELEQDHLNAILSVDAENLPLLEKLADSYKQSGDLVRYQSIRQKIKLLTEPAKPAGRMSSAPEKMDGMIHEKP